MIKCTLTGSNPVTTYLNPQHIVWIMERSDHTSSIRLMNGDNYSLQESGAVINDQMIAWQHRTHQ